MRKWLREQGLIELLDGKTGEPVIEAIEVDTDEDTE